MREIILSNGLACKVDDDDYEWLSQKNWHASKSNKKTTRTYAMRIEKRKPYKKVILMHRAIMKVTDRLTTVDHIDGDTLNNQRNNLRLASYRENSANQRMCSANTSGFKGVYLHKGKWVAYIRVNYRRIHLGAYQSKTEAAEAYDLAAIKHFGEFALTNQDLGNFRRETW